MRSSDIPTIVDGGASLVVATVSEDGEPRAARAWATTVVDPEALRVRIAMAADDDVAVGNLATGTIALTAADVRTLRSVQLKGRVMAVEPATAADLQRVVEHSDRFFDAVHETDGNPLPLLRRLLPHRVVAVELSVDEAFDQSPGSGAGEALRTPG